MSRTDQPNLPNRATSLERAAEPPGGPPDRAEVYRKPLPMLWRVFAANAAVFALAFAVLALVPIEIHASIRLDELVILIVGLVVMLLIDLVLLRQTLAPLTRLARVMRTVDLSRPGKRAVGFERSSTELLALANAFNGMLERLEHERRESTARVLAAQEQERLRIARELHDEIGQTLTAVALRAEHRAGQTTEQRPEYAELAEIVQQSLADVRRISLELRPGPLEELGLVNALISLCARVGEHSGMQVHRELASTVPEMPSDVELSIYRIAQEALTNALRHSGASDATVALTCADDQLMLTVTDNGRGLPDDVIAGGGLTGMRERALLIGGELQIGTPAGGGARVTLRLPLG